LNERYTITGRKKMSKKTKARITNDGLKGFFDRAREHARKLDRGEELAPEMTISFESAADMMKVLSPQRVRVLRVARQGAAPVSTLASGLKRDTRAVSRDVDLLEQFGLLRTRYQANPGHGRRRIVEPCAAKLQLVATV
jgi:predicted transcriptional regulator